MPKDISLLAECEGCHEKFNVSQGILTYKKPYKVSDGVIYLTYYDCSKCGKRHYVQVDDDKTLELLKVNEGQFIHNAVIRAKGKKLRKKKIDQYKDSRKYLTRYRKKLMEEYEGKQIYDEEKSSYFELRFST